MVANKQEQLQRYRGGNPHVNGSTPHRRQGPAAGVAAATAVASQAHNSLPSSSKRSEQTVLDKKVRGWIIDT